MQNYQGINLFSAVLTFDPKRRALNEIKLQVPRWQTNTTYINTVSSDPVHH